MQEVQSEKQFVAVCIESHHQWWLIDLSSSTAQSSTSPRCAMTLPCQLMSANTGGHAEISPVGVGSHRYEIEACTVTTPLCKPLLKATVPRERCQHQWGNVLFWHQHTLLFLEVHTWLHSLIYRRSSACSAGLWLLSPSIPVTLFIINSRQCRCRLQNSSLQEQHSATPVLQSSESSSWDMILQCLGSDPLEGTEQNLLGLTPSQLQAGSVLHWGWQGSVQHIGREVTRVTSRTCNLYITGSTEKTMTVSVLMSSTGEREQKCVHGFFKCNTNGNLGDQH